MWLNLQQQILHLPNVPHHYLVWQEKSFRRNHSSYKISIVTHKNLRKSGWLLAKCWAENKHFDSLGACEGIGVFLLSSHLWRAYIWEVRCNHRGEGWKNLTHGLTNTSCTRCEIWTVWISEYPKQWLMPGNSAFGQELLNYSTWEYFYDILPVFL